MRVPTWLLPHLITIERYRGEGPVGSVYWPPGGPVRALVSEKVRTVRDRTGAEVTSTAQVIAAPDLDCPPQSLITLPSGRKTTALHVAAHTAPGLPLPQSTEVFAE
ncbi:hypothetical protein SFUL_5513 [Streptomyces microflavus DSM 40593]|uniref:Uncharacterized protein n=1 Tax=Streptomyces microflavus DSM 40593 TaxID=1303692 RepID=N0CW98_STRMI|nr:hypothetical protein [Streptomyces microflavus]AGK80401.1 hypothetical protein SFUL_5513 [Streptomyces microflavus DSM 40593]